MNGLALAISQLAMIGSTSPAMSERELWQEIARADLEAIHSLVLEAHPVAIDTVNPDLKAWVEDGYTQAKHHLRYVDSYDTALSAVRYYVAGFEDGHFGYSDNIREDYPIWVTGWYVKLIDGQYVVTATVPGWPSSLPPVGAKWTGCDGSSAQDVAETKIGPYVDRLRGERGDLQRASSIWMRLPIADNFKECEFLSESNEPLRLAVEYRPITNAQMTSAWGPLHKAAEGKNSFEAQDGMLWIRAGTFNLRQDPRLLRDLEAMLDGLAKERSARMIVFDVRGNGGGDSGVGDRIFDAATGGLVYDMSDTAGVPRYFAQWRVSDYALAFLDDQIEKSKRLYGPNSLRVEDEIAFREMMRAAKEAGKQWVEQDGGYSWTREDVIARGGHLQRDGVEVALVTDRACASACLDFADSVMLVPGAIHLGETTSADSVYMVGSDSVLPSGNLLTMPIKVWRNRRRGNNEPYIPDVPLQLDGDEEEIRKKVRQVLERT